LTSAEASQSGIRVGDELLSINDHPFTGDAVFQSALADTPPGGSIRVVVRHGDDNVARTDVRLVPFGTGSYSFGNWLFAIIALLLVPVLGLCLGAGLVLNRIWDL